MKYLYFLTGCLLLTAVNGCGQGNASPAEATKRVYYCTATKTFLAAPPVQEYLGLNPQTGKKTLMPAMYCNKCKAWYQVPLPELMQRNPKTSLCPKTKTQLVREGPLPEQNN